MKCPSCAANYDDKFSFCPHCGTSKPQPPTVRVQVDQPVPVYVVAEPKYEYCRLHRRIVKQRFLRPTVLKYVAIGDTALNDDMVYGESEHYEDKSELDVATGNFVWLWEKAERALERKLLQDGWEEDPNDSFRFRRRIAQQSGPTRPQ